jgi:hypothetical protein
VGPRHAGGDFAASPGDLLHRGGVRKNRDRFQKALPFLGRHQDAGRHTVARDLNSIAAFFDAAQQLEQRVLGLGRGHGIHGWPL